MVRIDEIKLCESVEIMHSKILLAPRSKPQSQLGKLHGAVSCALRQARSSSLHRARAFSWAVPRVALASRSCPLRLVVSVVRSERVDFDGETTRPRRPLGALPKTHLTHRLQWLRCCSLHNGQSALGRSDLSLGLACSSSLAGRLLHRLLSKWMSQQGHGTTHTSSQTSFQPNRQSSLFEEYGRSARSLP